ncbi:hypothetical protein XENTR_v10021838 [Xenopus tropicalis]|nr:hypothetical protein XENTR_v10021838 [Xenopus tropicalis]
MPCISCAKVRRFETMKCMGCSHFHTLPIVKTLSKQAASLFLFQVCPRGQTIDHSKICRQCLEFPELYDWLYLGFMAMLPLILHWFFVEWYSGKKSSSALFQHITALFECTVAALATLLVSDPIGSLHLNSCRVKKLSDWYTMLYNPSPDYVKTLHCTHEAVYPLYTIVFIYYAFSLVLMMILRPLLIKKIACGLGKSDRFKSIYAALYFFPILTVIQAVGGGLLCKS